MNCKNCGKELNENAAFCDACGTPVNKHEASNADNKIIFILSYLGILFFLPLVVCPDSKTGKFHANQGLILLIVAVGGQIIIGIIGLIVPIIGSILGFVWGVLILVLVIKGMINANKELEEPLPVIGKYTIIK